MLLLILGILTSFLTGLEQSTLSSDCVLTISSEQSQDFSYPGSVVMEGDKFRLSILGMEAAYDGTTMYMYSEDTQELTLTNPTEQELQQINPLRFAKALAAVSRVEEKQAKNGNQVVTLYPNELSAGIMRVTLTLDKAGKLPVSIEVKEANQSSRLVFVEPILSPITSHHSPLTSFSLEKPGAFLNDLR